MSDSITAGLNPEQLRAVMHNEGPLLILAGAGSGKTSVLTRRIARLVAEGAPAYSILAVTFTNKAAREMRERVERLVPEGAGTPLVSTFHAFCVRVLRADPELAGLTRSFTIYDADDAEKLLKQMMTEMGISTTTLKPRDVATVIDGFRNQGYLPDEVPTGDPRMVEMVNIYRRYVQRLRRCNAVDFGDLLVLAHHLLRDNSAVAERYRSRFRWVLVDEYQDTNRVQYEIVALLVSGHRNICVVGDDDQCIFSWRGADLRNILDFKKDFPEAVVVKLEQNYRSTGHILSVANRLISNNTERMGKNLRTDKGAGSPVSVMMHASDRAESRYVADEVLRLLASGARPGDIAILYRTNAQSRLMEEGIRSIGVGYSIVGGLRFFDRMEIKDVMAYVRLVANPADDLAFARVHNKPARGIGKSVFDRIAEQASGSGVSYLDASRMLVDAGGLKKGAADKLAAFVSLYDSLTMRLAGDPVDLVRACIEETGYGDLYQKSSEKEDADRFANISELVNVAAEHGTVDEFVEHAALMSELDSLGRDESVTLMTVHAAKGLEFPVVFAVGFEEELFPHGNAVREGGLEEERRLCYVALTRAMSRLYVSFAKRRMVYGHEEQGCPSRFLFELDRDGLDRHSRALIEQLSREVRREW